MVAGARSLSAVAAPTIWTIGYEKLLPPALVAELQAAGVRRVIDVRFRPQSRRPGMSKTRLGALLREQGIAYEHRRELGTPPDMRWLFRTGRLAEARAAYRAHVHANTPEAIDELAAELGKPSDRRAAMMADAMASAENVAAGARAVFFSIAYPDPQEGFAAADAASVFTQRARSPTRSGSARPPSAATAPSRCPTRGRRRSRACGASTWTGATSRSPPSCRGTSSSAAASSG